jgi:hypothetical protein
MPTAYRLRRRRAREMMDHQAHTQHQGDEHQGRAVLEMTFQALKKGCHSVSEKAFFNSL